MRIPLLAAILLLVAAPPSAVSADEPLTLADCIDAVLTRSPRLAAGREAEAAAAAAAAAGAARRLPRLELGGSYDYTSEVMVQRLDLGPGGAHELRFGDEHRTDLSLGLSLPLFTGGELGRSASAAAAGADAAGERRAALALELKRDARLAFFAVLGREAQLASARLAQRRLERRLDATRTAVAVGSASVEDSLRVRARLREAEQRRLQAEATRDAAAIELGRLLGRPAGTLSVVGDLERPLIEPGAPSLEPVPSALPELRALDLEHERQELLAQAAGGRRLPRVDGALRGHYGRPGVDALANDWMTYATASLSLSWALWDGGLRGELQKQAEAEARRVAHRRQDAAEALAAARARARAELAAARAEVVAASEGVELQGRILELVGGRRDRAQATENEVLDAQDDLSEAEAALALARTRARQAEATLLWTLGR